MGKDGGGCAMSTKSIDDMTSEEKHEAVRLALAEVDRRLASGELDGSGRYYSDEELAAGAATGGYPKKLPASKATAA
jgi:hypothetical protein